jgi:hypothetical protein
MRKFIAIFLVIFLVFPLLLSAQAAISVTSWALDRQFYIDTLDQPQIYSTLTTSPMIDKLLHVRLGLPPEADTSELESILKGILTTDYMRGQVSEFINALFDYLQGKTDTFAPTLDAVPLKTALEGSQQDAFLNALVAALPPCGPNQIPGFGGEGQTACKPAGIPDDLLVEQVLKPALPSILSAVPDEIPLEGEFQNWQESARWRTFLPGMAVPASVILSLLVLVFIAACAWYVAALISDTSWRVRLQWLGWTLLVPAALIFLLGFTAQSGIPAYWIRFGLDSADLSNTPFGPELNETLRIISVSAIPRIASAFQMVGGISGALSIALIFWGIATPRKRRKELE